MTGDIADIVPRAAEELDLQQLYGVAEAATLLGLAPTTLRDRVTAGLVPHMRLHTRKGVRFTADQIREIRASMIRPANRHPGEHGGAGAGPDLSRFSELRSVRP
jgi:hypothetical protein